METNKLYRVKNSVSIHDGHRFQFPGKINNPKGLWRWKPGVRTNQKYSTAVRHKFASGISRPREAGGKRVWFTENNLPPHPFTKIIAAIHFRRFASHMWSDMRARECRVNIFHFFFSRPNFTIIDREAIIFSDRLIDHFRRIELFSKHEKIKYSKKDLNFLK